MCDVGGNGHVRLTSMPKAQVECSLRLTLEYIIVHGSLRELLSIQEQAVATCGGAGLATSQEALGAIPRDFKRCQRSCASRWPR